ncbi:MAG: (Fe-S)-binding protein [Candidatus Marinimicrobia bacterium]|nr:(Fe-S)-binding protein [Candidatus Neomarinimicrobiota bacterium]
MEFQLPDCVHCGLCLTACPTYLVTGLEAESPRGRLMFMNSLQRDENPANSSTSAIAYAHLDTCLDCRACATACPSGVDYPGILDQVRHRQAVTVSPPSMMKRVILSLAVNKQIRTLGQIFLWTFQRIGVINLLAKGFPTLKGLPKLTFRSFSGNQSDVLPPIGKRKGSVALFTGCVMDNLYTNVHESTLRLLRWNGYEVHIPKRQTCCGALHHHNGVQGSMSSFVNQNIDAFRNHDAIIMNAAGCGAELKDYPDPQFTGKVFDITEFLESIEMRPVNTADRDQSLKVIWDAPCHLVHGQKIQDAPHRILKHFGLEEISFPQSHLCCGSAGSFMLTQPEMAESILKMKTNDIERTGCDVIITANPGCQMHIQKGLTQYSIHKKVKHICEVLDENYQTDQEYRETLIKGKS